MDIERGIGNIIRLVGKKLPKCKTPKDIDELTNEVKRKFYDLAESIT